MSVINSANLQVGQSTTATNNITLNTDGSGNLIINKGVYPTLTEISRITNAGLTSSDKTSYTPSGTGAVATTVQSKLRESVSVLDFGALGDGTGRKPSDDGIVATSASWNVWPSWITGATYGTKPGHDYGDATYLANNKPFTNSDTWDFIGITLAIWACQSAGGGSVFLTGTTYVVNRPIRFVMGAAGIGCDLVGRHKFLTKIIPLTAMTPMSGIGAPVIYMYRIGLSGVNIRNLTISTYPLNGGAPTPQTDPTLVMFDNMFMSGYGEAGLVGLNISSFEAKNIITEYYTIAVVLRGTSNAFIEDSVIFSSSGTGVNSWKTCGVYLNTSAAYISGGQFSLMRGWSVYSTGSGNSFTFNNVVNVTTNYGLIFQCEGLDQWSVQGCTFKYGSPNTTPMVLLDGVGGGSRPLSSTFVSGQFVGNAVSNTSSYAYDVLWVTGTGVQITDNNFNVLATGANTGGYVIDSLLNSSYSGPGTVNAIFTNNVLRNNTMSQVSVFGMISSNIDSNGVQESQPGTWVPSFTGLVVVNGTGGATYSGTYKKIGKTVYWTATITVTGTCTTQCNNGSTYINNLPFTPVFPSLVQVSITANNYVIGGASATNGYAYPPSWGAVNSNIYLSGSYNI
jgi:hypothetical protein